MKRDRAKQRERESRDIDEDGSTLAAHIALEQMQRETRRGQQLVQYIARLSLYTCTLWVITGFFSSSSVGGGGGIE